MLKIGITGGIGSGKTTVTRVFEVLGIPVYNADQAAKRLMNEDAALKEKIKQEFGNDVYKNEKLDNKYLAQIVFS
jgi:dephospho-CoA kinase